MEEQWKMGGGSVLSIRICKWKTGSFARCGDVVVTILDIPAIGAQF
jgi:hypothetical protein